MIIGVSAACCGAFAGFFKMSAVNQNSPQAPQASAVVLIAVGWSAMGSSLFLSA
jgi:hypothetical protein